MGLAILLFLALAGLAATPASREASRADSDRIRPWPKNPRYWQYKGKPVLLLGGTDDDNLFQWTVARLTDHLDLLKSVGGNYVRCTMSSRDKGNVWPFAMNGRRYDLDGWNDEFWRRFECFLAETARRDIIVQIEVWAFHDFNKAAWLRNPWRPANTVSYTTSNTTLKDFYGDIGKVPHRFFFTVPKLGNDGVVLAYQRKFVDRMLSYTLQYGHVLYCMTNEIHPLYSPEWGWYWCDYIKGKAAAAGKQVEATEMYWPPHLDAKQHHASLDPPNLFTYFEASQNSAVLDGQTNWDNLQSVWNYLAGKPRPINHVKIYGADGSPWEKVTRRKAAECFWRNLIGGSASSRFHRPPHGLGLTKSARAHIKSMRLLTSELDIFNATPDSQGRRLSRRSDNGAYLTCVAGRQYAVYFPDGGSVDLDLSGVAGSFSVKWLDVAHSTWNPQQTLEGGRRVTLRSPGKGHWVVLLATRAASRHDSR